MPSHHRIRCKWLKQALPHLRTSSSPTRDDYLGGYTLCVGISSSSIIVFLLHVTLLPASSTMASKVPAKSILKQPAAKKTPTITDEQKAQADKDRKNLKIALKHAYLIQHRKDVEATLLNSITELLDLPAASKHTRNEALTFISLVTAFQPSDYDSLIEERRTDSRCGYVLCSNPPRSKTIGSSVSWKLKQGMGDWCSDACAKKGLYVKAQLSEVPAWERVPEQNPDVRLHEEDQPVEDDATERRANRTARVDEWRQKVSNDEELARERGENATSLRPNQVMVDAIVEKQPKPFRHADLKFDVGHYSSIEGYQPRNMGKSKKLGVDSDDDEANDDDE